MRKLYFLFMVVLFFVSGKAQIINFPDANFKAKLLQPGGLLSSSVGSLLGTDPGRGIGLMFILSGILMIGISSLVWKSKSLGKLE